MWIIQPSCNVPQGASNEISAGALGEAKERIGWQNICGWFQSRTSQKSWSESPWLCPSAIVWRKCGSHSWNRSYACDLSTPTIFAGCFPNRAVKPERNLKGLNRTEKLHVSGNSSVKLGEVIPPEPTIYTPVVAHATCTLHKLRSHAQNWGTRTNAMVYNGSTQMSKFGMSIAEHFWTNPTQ